MKKFDSFFIQRFVKTLPLSLLLVFVFASTAFADYTWENVPAGYGLAWSDEFNGAVGSAPSSTNWSYNTGTDCCGNNELETYTTSTANAQIIADPNAVDGKSLAIIALDPGGNNDAAGDYTSARITSENKQIFTYGYMEARVRMPYGQGIWPAFWMLGNDINTAPWPACGEIDIMENIGQTTDQGTNHMSLHDGNDCTTYLPLPGGQLYHNAYHTFAALWQANQIQFFVDGSLMVTDTPATLSNNWVFNNNPSFFLLNCAVGGSWPGNPDTTTSFPQTMYVDYVRAYQTGFATPTPVVQSTWRVHSGGDNYTDSQGNLWVADTNFTGGWPSESGTAITGTVLPTTNDQSLYQWQRYGNATGGETVTYTFNVSTGSNYQVDLKFAETYWTAANQRQFNYSINGTTEATNFDIFATAGGQNKALDEVYNNIAPNANGQIVIQFTQGAYDNPSVGSIQIVPVASTPTATPTPVVASTWRVNAGGPQYTDTLGDVWSADENYSGGTAAVTTSTITGADAATDPTVYQSQRYGTSFTYTFNVPTGSYQVSLLFAETYFTAAGDRAFNVSINGTTVLTNFDIYATAGGQNIGVVEAFNSIAPSGGVITITFGPASVNNAEVQGIQIIPQPATATPTSTFSKTTTSTFTSTLTNTPTLTFTATTSSTFTNTVTSTMTNTLSATATRTNSNTPTTTFTSSYTSTPSNTSTSSFTNTSTVSSTATNTPVGTLTLVDTNTPMNTATLTSTGTSTLSPTASYTSSSTATLTPSVTNTLTFTSTTTDTPTNTPAIPTSTKTYTLTPSATMTNTPTSTGPATFTLTATLTYTSTLTKTPTATAIWTYTSTNTPKPELPTATYTFSVTPTYTHTPVPPTSTPTTSSACSGVPAWNGNFVAYSIGQKVTYDGELYQCIQAHTSEITWEPNVVPALWKDLGSCGSAPAPALIAAQPVVYPNPATSSTTSIQLPVTNAANVTVQIFTVVMRQVQAINVPQVKGNTLTVQLVDKSGVSLANGLYYFLIQANGQKWTNKVLVLR